jgi:hypothetical protein
MSDDRALELSSDAETDLATGDFLAVIHGVAIPAQSPAAGTGRRAQLDANESADPRNALQLSGSARAGGYPLDESSVRAAGAAPAGRQLEDAALEEAVGGFDLSASVEGVSGRSDRVYIWEKRQELRSGH